MSLFDKDDDRGFKAAIHGATLALAVEMSAYHLIVYRKRGTRWHVFSACAYLALCVLETAQISRHMGEQA